MNVNDNQSLLRKLSIWAILFATCLLVVAPLLRAQLRDEVLRWQLAKATNAVELGIGNDEELLQKVESSGRDIKTLRDYWLFRLKKGLANDRTAIPSILKEAIAIDPSFCNLTPIVEDQLWKTKEFATYVEVVKLAQRPEAMELPEYLNKLAYARSLAAVELEEALIDINRALEFQPNNPMMLDTRAWVLYQMKRYEEALVDAEKAISMVESSISSTSVTYSVTRVLEDWLLSSQIDKQAKDQNSIDPVLLAFGALRYHRAMILEALDRKEDAAADRLWIESYGLKDVDLF